MKSSTQELKRTIALLGGKSSHRGLTPPSIAFGAVVEERLRGLQQQLDEVKGRVNGLVYTLVGAVIVEIVLRVI